MNSTSSFLPANAWKKILFTASTTFAEYLKVKPFFLLHASPSEAKTVGLILESVLVTKINRNKFILLWFCNARGRIAHFVSKIISCYTVCSIKKITRSRYNTKHQFYISDKWTLYYKEGYIQRYWKLFMVNVHWLNKKRSLL